MEKKPTPRDLKRIESDKRILRATVQIVGEKGYKNANIRDIAKLAGITPGLITQRFETKENLLVQAIHSTNVVWVDRKIPQDTPVEVLLKGIIAEIKRIFVDDPVVYKFLQVVSNSTDLPADIQYLQLDHFKESGVYDILNRGQMEGYLPKGEISILYNIFINHMLKLVLDYNEAGLTIPDDKHLLAIIQYKDPVAEEQNYLRAKAFESISQSFFSLIYFNLDTGESRIARTIKEIEDCKKDSKDSQNFLNKACNKLVDIKHQKDVKEFINLSTVIKRLGDSKVIAQDFVGTDKCSYRISFIFVTKEKGKNIVLCGIQKLRDK